MGVLAAIGTALITAVAGLFAAGYVAHLCVGWYRVTQREGAAGYFVVFIALAGGLAGLMVGATCGALAADGSALGFFKGVGWALVVVVVSGVAGAGVSRAMADVPPTLEGQELFLVVEVRGPVGEGKPPTPKTGERACVRLGSMAHGRVRKSERGPLWAEEATVVDGRWVARGAVAVFTSRGKRLLVVEPGTGHGEGFPLPLRRFPAKRDEQWSEWLPKATPRFPRGAEGYQFRYRVQRWSEPMRVEALPGGFDAAVVVQSIQESWGDNAPPRPVTMDYFRLRHGGRPVSIGGAAPPPERALPDVDLLVTFPSPRPAFIVNSRCRDEKARDGYALYLLSEADGGEARVDVLTFESNAAYNKLVVPVDGGEAIAAPTSPHRLTLPGGLYRVGWDVIFDTAALSSHRYSPAADTLEAGDFRALAVSPDRRSFVRFTYGTNGNRPQLTVTNFVADRSFSLPIDRRRMHYAKVDQVDGVWVGHHFRWERDPVEGVDRLVEREAFEPLAYRAETTTDAEGKVRWWLEGVGKALRPAIDAVVEKEFGAQPVSAMGEGDYEHVWAVGAAKISVAADDSHHVNVEISPGAEAGLGERVAKRVDEELATGKYDAMFCGE